MSRRSYTSLSQRPVWLLIDKDTDVVASVRARNQEEAKRLFLSLPAELRHGGIFIVTYAQWSLPAGRRTVQRAK